MSERADLKTVVWPFSFLPRSPLTVGVNFIAAPPIGPPSERLSSPPHRCQSTPNSTGSSAVWPPCPASATCRSGRYRPEKLAVVPLRRWLTFTLWTTRRDGTHAPDLKQIRIYRLSRRRRLWSWQWSNRLLWLHSQTCLTSFQSHASWIIHQQTSCPPFTLLISEPLLHLNGDKLMMSFFHSLCVPGFSPAPRVVRFLLSGLSIPPARFLQSYGSFSQPHAAFMQNEDRARESQRVPLWLPTVSAENSIFLPFSRQTSRSQTPSATRTHPSSVCLRTDDS